MRRGPKRAAFALVRARRATRARGGAKTRGAGMTKRTSRRPRWRTALPATSVALALTGCVVGPDFHAPAAPRVADETHPYTDAPLPAQTASAPVAAGASQRFV